MRHKRKVISIGLAALMLVSLCAVCATTSVTAATTTATTTSRGTQTSSQNKLADIVGAPPGGLTSAPTVCSWGNGRLDVFARGTYSHLWHTWWDGTWHSWEDLLTPDYGLWSAPTAVSWGNGRIDVFVIDVYAHLQHKWFDIYNGWSNWENVGAPFVNFFKWGTAPTAVSWGPGRIDVFVAGSDGQLWQKWWSASNGWQAWVPLGKPSVGLDGSPGALSTVSWGYPRIDIFIRGSDGALWQKWWGNGWQPWHRFDDTAGLLESQYNDYYYAPAVCSWGANRLDVFFVDTSGHLQQKWFDGSWHDLYNVGGTQVLIASPSAVAWQLGGTTRIDIFSCYYPNFALYQLYWAAGSGWHGWYDLSAV